MSNLGEVLEGLRAGPLRRHGRLGCRPVYGRGEPGGWVPLAEALERGWVEVTEVSEEGSVNDLLIRNRGDRPVLALEGEALVGAKQNRVLNLTILAGPGSETEVPVSCVEAGRWAWRGRRFEADEAHLHPKARTLLCRRVSENYREGEPRADQAEIWDEVARKLDGMGVESGTADLLAARRRYQAQVDEAASAFEPEADQVGVVFYLDGKPIGLEILGDPPTLAAYLPRLVRGYALDALEPGEPTVGLADSDFEDLVATLAEAAPERRPAVGLGEQWRIDAGPLVGSALVEGGRLVHLSAFVDGAPGGEGHGGRQGVLWR